jgi:transcriptional antiterminator RfaH
MNWYCIHTRPRREERARQYFKESIGLEAYCPRLREQRVIRRVRRTITRPLFPRYLFCRFEPAVHYRAARYSPDVIDIVHFGGLPNVVPDQLIEDLKAWVGDALDADMLRPPLTAGDVVMICEGPLMGLQAVVQRAMSDSERVSVLLSSLDCAARMMVMRSQLRLVS